MTRDLEDELRQRIKSRDPGRSVRDVIEDMRVDGRIRSEKQAHATLLKWSKRGEYEYGVTLDLGWLK